MSSINAPTVIPPAQWPRPRRDLWEPVAVGGVAAVSKRCTNGTSDRVLVTPAIVTIIKINF